MVPQKEDSLLTKSERDPENKENDLREEEERTEGANEYGREAIERVFIRLVSMRTYKYVNEVHSKRDACVHHSKISS